MLREGCLLRLASLKPLGRFKIKKNSGPMGRMELNNHMDPNIQEALTKAATAAHILDPDVLRLPEFADAVALVQITDGQVDAASVQAAIAKMQATKPQFFKPWQDLDSSEFAEREKAFREGLRRSKAVGPNEWRDLDASRLNSTELDALTKAIGGNVNAYDRGVLLNARQRLRGGAA